jgi:hypothetical protein
MALLTKFHFEIKHIKGKENRVVDALSRSTKTIHLAAVSTCEIDVKNRVRNAQETDPFIQIVTLYLQQEPARVKYEGYQMTKGGLLTYRDRLYIPNCDDLKRFIMDELHKIPYTGHPGYQKMITATRKQFYCLGMKEMEQQVTQIKQNLKVAWNRQKSYSDQKRTPREFKMGDHVYLRIKPRRSSLKMGACAKLAPQYCGPFEVLDRVGPVAY